MPFLIQLVMICIITIVLVGLGTWPSWMLFVPPIGMAIGYGTSWIRTRRRRS